MICQEAGRFQLSWLRGAKIFQPFGQSFLEVLMVTLVQLPMHFLNKGGKVVSPACSANAQADQKDNLCNYMQATSFESSATEWPFL